MRQQAKPCKRITTSMSVIYFCNEDAAFLHFTYSGRMKIFVLVESAPELLGFTEKLSQALINAGVVPVDKRVEKEGKENKPQAGKKRENQGAAGAAAKGAKAPAVAITTESLKEVVSRRNAVHGDVAGQGPVCSFEVTKHSRRQVGEFTIYLMTAAAAAIPLRLGTACLLSCWTCVTQWATCEWWCYRRQAPQLDCCPGMWAAPCCVVCPKGAQHALGGDFRCSNDGVQLT